MNKVSLLLGILLVLAIGAAGYFWLQGQQVKQEFQDFIAESYGPDDDMVTSTPTPAIQDETANWKTYTNKKFNYTLKYPSGWDLVFQPEHVRVSSELSSSFNLANFTIEFPIYNLESKQMMISGYVYSANEDSCFSYSNLSKNKSQIIVDGIHGFRYDTREEDASGQGDVQNATKIVLWKNKLCYVISMTPITSDSDLMSNFENILSTFKFTDN